MKAVILAGGRGTRIAEESHLRPKPMIEIGGMPILWHIMKIYSHFGVNEFVICLGYKGHMVKEYFTNYCLHASDITIDLAQQKLRYHSSRAEPWTVTLVDTGQDTLTGGRLKRVREYVEHEESFCLTYGDGLANIDIGGEIRFHRRHGLQASMTVVRPPARFGSSVIHGDRVVEFEEKPQAGDGFVNGGFFVFSPKVLDLIESDETSLERGPLERLASMKQLAAWRHTGFWQPMDTLRDREFLESEWSRRDCPWRLWQPNVRPAAEALCAS